MKFIMTPSYFKFKIFVKSRVHSTLEAKGICNFKKFFGVHKLCSGGGISVFSLGDVIRIYYNPLFHSVHNCSHIWGQTIRKWDGMSKTISYKRRVYESVDDRSLS